MSASAKQVSQLAGFLMHISFAVRPGSFFVHRLLAPAGMPSIAAGLDFSDRMATVSYTHLTLPTTPYV